MWKAKLKNGRDASELNTKWDDIKGDVSELLLVTSANQIICLPKNATEYLQFKTASCEMGSNSSVQIESRVVGFKLNDNLVKVRVNEKTNNINIEID